MDALKKCFYVLILLLGVKPSFAQDTSMKTLSLEDMSAFKPQAGNWQIVGDVLMDPSVDIHKTHEKPSAEAGKKSKKQKAPPPSPKAVTYQPGKGILLNINDDTRKDNLVTAWEHGDIELEFDVMLPKGSNSGIYLQGRYEVQLFDSWGVRNPSFSDIGGIYRNWEREPGKIYMGKAPLSNPSKAPGLWQHMRILFRAPQFDSNGIKTANARFVVVELNGVTIHDNVEVPLPTGGPVQNNEKPTGPLMIQGDHGPVAFRNFRYRMMKEGQFTLSPVSYKVYHGNFKTFNDFASSKPVLTGTSPELSTEVVEVDNAYGVIYSANLTVPEDATYEFHLAYTGGIRLMVNNQQLLNVQTPDDWRDDRATIALKAGTYPIEIFNFKDAGWAPPRLALFIGAPQIYPKALHAFNSYPPDNDPVASVFVSPGSEPKLLRAFLDFKKDRSQRLTHTIGVGDPVGIHYVYDLKAGNLVCTWRGDFVDATPMWHDRGDGSFRPRGAVQYLFTGQPLAFLPNQQEAFPASGKDGEFRGKGYAIEPQTGRPVFKYQYQGLEIEDRIFPDDNNRSITHEVLINKRGDKQGLYYKLAEGSSILPMPDGSYAVDDKQYYVKVASSYKPSVRELNGKKELVVPVEGNVVKYSITW